MSIPVPEVSRLQSCRRIRYGQPSRKSAALGPDAGGECQEHGPVPEPARRNHWPCLPWLPPPPHSVSRTCAGTSGCQARDAEAERTGSGRACGVWDKSESSPEYSRQSALVNSSTFDLKYMLSRNFFSWITTAVKPETRPGSKWTAIITVLFRYRG